MSLVSRSLLFKMADQVVDPVIEKPWQKKLRMERHHANRGSRYPPFSIEPLPYERNRLAGSGMTEEQRALRKQWVQDQILSADEPRNDISVFRPRNAFRRMVAKPWDLLFKPMIPLFGKSTVHLARNFVPKLSMLLGGIYLAYYQLKYHHNDWTKVGGFAIYESKPMTLDEISVAPVKSNDDYCDREFKARTALRNIKTSSME